MDKIGSYILQNIPLSSDDYATLYLYQNDREVIVYFKRNKPYYHVDYVAVCIERTKTYDSYDLYQYEFINESEETVKKVIGEIVNGLFEM